MADPSDAMERELWVHLVEPHTSIRSPDCRQFNGQNTAKMVMVVVEACGDIQCRGWLRYGKSKVHVRSPL